MLNFLRAKARELAPLASDASQGRDSGRRGRSALVLLLLLLISALPASSDPLAFTGDTLITFSSGALQPGVDLSGLQFGNTADGVEISGSLSVSFPDTGGVLTVGGLEIVSERFFVAPLGTNVTPLAHASGSFVNSEGGLWLTAVSVSTTLNPHPSGGGPCAASIGMELGDFGGPFAGNGAFDVTTTENNVNPSTPCSTVDDDSGAFQNSLTQVFSVSYIWTGSAGGLTIDLGNSVLSELTEVLPEPPVPPVPVPEPSSTFLMGSTLLIILFRIYATRKDSTRGGTN